VRYTAGMANPVPPKQGPRPLLAAAAFAGAALVAALTWYAWRITAGGAPAAPVTAQAPHPAPPPAPPLPYAQLVTAPAPVPAPAIELPTADGKRFSLAALRGQVVMVNFWATWCPPCAKEMPSMVALGQELARRHPGKFRLVAVSVDEEPGAVARFFSAPAFGGLPRDVVVALEPGSGEVTRGYYCRGRGACRPDEVKFPETYIVDREGRIVALVVGDIDWSTPGPRHYLEALIAG
jgi:thiol-disulfide isomerase/thioredoxin